MGSETVRCMKLEKMPAGRVVLLVIDNDFYRIAARYLAEKFPQLKVIVERRISRRSLLQRRIRQRGFVHVVGQLAFMFYAGLLARISRNRIRKILEEHRLEAKLARSRAADPSAVR
jgi:hypothetical protein